MGRGLGIDDILAWHNLGIWSSIPEPVYGQGQAGVESPSSVPGGESGVGACGLLGILGRGSVQREKPAGLLGILVWEWTFLGTFLVAFL